MTSSIESAQDLVQETFLAAHKGIGSFKGESEPRTWMFAILNNKIANHFKSQFVQQSTVDTNSISKSEEVTDSMFEINGSWKNRNEWLDWGEMHLLDNKEFLKVFNACIEDLPVKWRIAILMKYRNDQSSEEICKELNISMSNYWQLIHRSKLLLKKCIDINW